MSDPELQRKGIEIKLKGKVLVIDQDVEDPIHISCNNEPLEKVDNYQYLGTIFSIDGRMNQEVLHRVKKANGVFYSICTIGKQEIKKETEISLFRTVFLSVLLYGSES